MYKSKAVNFFLLKLVIRVVNGPKVRHFDYCHVTWVLQPILFIYRKRSSWTTIIAPREDHFEEIVSLKWKSQKEMPLLQDLKSNSQRRKLCRPQVLNIFILEDQCLNFTLLCDITYLLHTSVVCMQKIHERRMCININQNNCN